jgi:DNA-directed RNA polymerase specialized sigma24 family protein
MLSLEEVWPILQNQARVMCRQFPDAHLEEEDLIGEAWLKDPCDVNHPKLAQVKVRRDMLDYVRQRLCLRDKYHRFRSPLLFLSPDRFYDILVDDRRFATIDFQDLLKVLLNKSNLRSLEKVIVVQCLVVGRTQREVAQKIGRSPGYISSCLTRAKQRLKEVCIDLGVTNGK